MRALLGVGPDGEIGLIGSDRFENGSDESMLAVADTLGRTGWSNLVIIDDKPDGLGQVNCTLRKVSVKPTVEPRYRR